MSWRDLAKHDVCINACHIATENRRRLAECVLSELQSLLPDLRPLDSFDTMCNYMVNDPLMNEVVYHAQNGAHSKLWPMTSPDGHAAIATRTIPSEMNSSSLLTTPVLLPNEAVLIAEMGSLGSEARKLRTLTLYPNKE